ncbi:GNAT family N-acetyltransferase [Paenibacillus caseinilyticus]|uniref:GNAT family N-acetyltransferase n=1 Tax=Paenibacillus caseinilyticus TaxID=3098138 RepID=UPI0022B86225|nr:GNAT family N-acetyltransferase [Paenibacillus caseinilyticus]
MAQTRFPKSLQDGTAAVREMLERAAQEGCALVCFPEAVIPGLRGVGHPVESYDHGAAEAALEEVRETAGRLGVAVILPMEWRSELGLHLVAFVISETGELLGYQTKNQIDPDEDAFGYVAGTGRRIFAAGGLTFGIAICHEAWRYPETVRWAAQQGAQIVFHPQYTGKTAYPAFYQGALLCRSLENGIYFASVNYALVEQDIASQVIGPSGERLCEAGTASEELAVCDIDPSLAERRLVERFRPDLLADDLSAVGASEALEGEQISLRVLTPVHTETLFHHELANRDFFCLYTGTTNEDFYTVEGQRNRILRYLRKRQRDEAYLYGIFLRESGELIGTISLMEVMRGSLQSCFVGYTLDKAHNGKGYMTEAVRLLVKHAFEVLGLQRIDAGVMPHNTGSIRVLEKAGFRQEGLARKNVEINGVRQDHLMLGIVREPADPAVTAHPLDAG